MNYAKALPRDTGGAAMQNYPAARVSTARANTENAVASSVISLSPDTTTIEVGTFGGQGAVIRWVPITETAAAAGAKASVISSGASANFDHYIPTNTVRTFVVPKETIGQMSGQAGSVNGLYQRMARISAGIIASSVLVSEF
jgi:hypothetical protein